MIITAFRTDELSLLSSEVETKFGKLNAIQLNWKPEEKSWSVGQCLHHLITTNSEYLKTIDQIVAGKFKPSFWSRISPFTKTIGKSMKETLGKNVTKKFVAPKLFQPKRSNISPTVVNEFIQLNNQIVKALKELEKRQAGKIIISSPAAALITLNLSDASEIMLGHNQRHFAQAERVMQINNFPKA